MNLDDVARIFDVPRHLLEPKNVIPRRENEAVKVTDGMVEAFADAWKRAAEQSDMDLTAGERVRTRLLADCDRAGLAAAFEVARRDMLCDRMAHAPETQLQRSKDVLDRAQPFMRPCGPCDFGLAEFGCSCPREDFRGTVADLVGEIERLRERVRKLDRLEAAGVDNWSGYDTAMRPLWDEEEQG